MAKKWSEMTTEEKVEAMPEFKKTVETRIKDLKKQLKAENAKLKSLVNEEKAMKFELIEKKAKANNQNVEDLM